MVRLLLQTIVLHDLALRKGSHLCTLETYEALLLGESDWLEDLLHDLAQQLHLHTHIRLIGYLSCLDLADKLVDLSLDGSLAPSLSVHLAASLEKLELFLYFYCDNLSLGFNLITNSLLPKPVVGLSQDSLVDLFQLRVVRYLNAATQ